MGSSISQAADGFGRAIGNLLAAPFKNIFSGSCEDICAGAWDFLCFIEHLCVSNLARLFLILGLCYIILFFFYLLFKLGICQCIVISLCKMCWAACETYWFALWDLSCYLCHKLMNTKRVYRRRRRFRDLEVGYNPSGQSDSETYHHLSHSRKRKSGGHNHIKSTSSSNVPGHRHHLKLKPRQISFRVRGGSSRYRSSRDHQYKKLKGQHRKARKFKRRRLQ